jgi:hypothetical protein
MRLGKADIIKCEGIIKEAKLGGESTKGSEMWRYKIRSEAWGKRRVARFSVIRNFVRFGRK